MHEQHKYMIIKYTLSNESDYNTYKLSKDFHILDIQCVRGDIVIYFGVYLNKIDIPLDLVDPVEKTFRLVRTGQILDGNFLKNYEYRGTASVNGGIFVGHVFMRKDVESLSQRYELQIGHLVATCINIKINDVWKPIWYIGRVKTIKPNAVAITMPKIVRDWIKENYNYSVKGLSDSAVGEFSIENVIKQCDQIYLRNEHQGKVVGFDFPNIVRIELDGNEVQFDLSNIVQLNREYGSQYVYLE